jgi:Xaa-Pro aminopeptidase
MPGKEIIEKERRVREFMTAQGIDGVLLSRRDNFSWFTGGRQNYVVMGTDAGFASVLVTRDAKYVLTTNIEAPRIAEEEVADQGFARIVGVDWYAAGAREKALAELCGGKVASDDGAPGSVPLPPAFAELRASLTEAEVTRYRALGLDCGLALAEVAAGVTPGETEASIAARTARACLDMAVLPHVILVAADERIRKHRHPIFTNARVHSCVMIVLCGLRHGLICSLTRLVHFGALPRDLKRRHQAVTLIDATLNARTRVGAGVGDILKAGIAQYAAAGFAEEWKLHHQGGPTGYAGRDYLATPEETRAVQPNQAFAWNPSITGTKCEDTLIALKNGPLIISLAGDWPTITHRVDGLALQRPDILVK